MAITFAEVQRAARAIAGSVARTPRTTSRTLSEITGARVVLKFENHQFTASFKERGALARLLCLDASERARGVVAMSAGNHAQALEVSHQRSFGKVPLRTAEVEFVLHTRGAEHLPEITAALAAKGYASSLPDSPPAREEAR